MQSRSPWTITPESTVHLDLIFILRHPHPTAMPFIAKMKGLVNKTLPLDTSTVGTRSRSPLHLPELLTHILSFLSQSTLRFTIALVCHEWRNISRKLYRPQLAWSACTPSSPMEREMVLAKLPMARVLSCNGMHFHGGISRKQDPNAAYPSWGANWELFLITLDDLAKEGRLQIQDLTLTNLQKVSLEEQLWPLLGTLARVGLATLEIKDLGMPWIPIGKILSSCPMLSSLTLRTHHKSIGGYTVARLSLGTTPTVGPTETDQDQEPLQRLRLQNLCLEMVVVEENILESILEASPHLRELSLIAMVAFPTASSTITSNAKIFPLNQTNNGMLVSHESFCRMIANRPHLTSLHFSHYGEKTTFRNQAELLERCPNLHAFGMLGRDFVPAMFKALQLTPNTITSLEIQGELDRPCQDALHEFLCASPLLLHLRAIRSYYNLDNMDLDRILNGRGQYRTRDDVEWEPKGKTYERLPPTIWACRSLKTLHLTFHKKGMPAIESFESSRLLFGYLTRVCPLLEDLWIRRTIMSLWLPSGLCLLARLHWLQRLTLETGVGAKFETRDLIWIVPELSSYQLMKNRALIKDYMAQEKIVCDRAPTGTVLARRPQSRSTGTTDTATTSTTANKDTCRSQLETDDTIVHGISFRNMGRLLDIVDWIQEREQNTTKGERRGCWPELETLTFHFQRYGEFSPIKTRSLLQKMRPHLEVRTLYSSNSAYA